MLELIKYKSYLQEKLKLSLSFKMFKKPFIKLNEWEKKELKIQLKARC